MVSAPAEKLLTSHVTDEMLARALTDDVLAGKLADLVIAGLPADPSRFARKPKGHMAAALIPVGHGMAAMATFVLAVVTTAGIR